MTKLARTVLCLEIVSPAFERARSVALVRSIDRSMARSFAATNVIGGLVAANAARCSESTSRCGMCGMLRDAIAAAASAAPSSAARHVVRKRTMS